MHHEIERKYLLNNNHWRSLVKQTYAIKQGYLSIAVNQTVRVRIKGDKGYMTVKGQTVGITRIEFEYEIPAAQAQLMLQYLCLQPTINKMRHIVLANGYEFEIDEFFDENAGLIIAELELGDTDKPLNLPEWIGLEVSDDARYYNSALMQKPYKVW